MGYGFDARTTLESAVRFRRVNPDLPMLGVEIDKESVDAALPYADEKTFYRLDDFNLPLKEGRSVRLIRAFDVLPAGLIIEGTSTPYGQIWDANAARKKDSGNWDMEALNKSIYRL